MREALRGIAEEAGSIAVGITEGWHDFYVAVAGAAAALAGLVVVAISINLREILASPRLPGRAATTVAVFVNVLLISVFGLVPQLSTTLLGWLTLLGTAIIWVAVVISFARTHIDPEHRATSTLQILLWQASLLPLLVGSALLIAGNPDGLAWFVAGIAISLVTGVENAWALLVEILR